MSNWSYIILKPAQRYLERMQINEQKRIIKALDDLVSDKNKELDIKSLKGRPEKRLRVGKYRILFRENSDRRLYVVTTIGSRGDVYK